MRTWVEQLAVRAGPDLVNDSGLQKRNFKVSTASRIMAVRSVKLGGKRGAGCSRQEGAGGAATSRSRNTQRGTCLPAPVSEKNVLNASSPPPIVLSEGICPSGWMPCSRQYSSQQALPTCVTGGSSASASSHLRTVKAWGGLCRLHIYRKGGRGGEGGDLQLLYKIRGRHGELVLL